MLGRLLDRAISIFSPERGLRRVAARSSLEQHGAWGFGFGKAGYDAVTRDRLQRCKPGAPVCENDLPSIQFDQLRWLSWQLYRTTPQARKAVNSLQSKIVGQGCRPHSTATVGDETEADQGFRTAAEALFRQQSKCCDVRGLPGFGGMTFGQMQRQIIKNVILSGELLIRFTAPDLQDKQTRPLAVPTLLQMIPASRLNILYPYRDAEKDLIFRGVEFDLRGRRVAYHLLPSGFPWDYCGCNIGGLQDGEIIPATEILHPLVCEDIDQVRGTPWLAAALRNMSGIEDYQHNELVAAEMAACVVLGYSKSTGQTQWGLQGSNQDCANNPMTHIQPGMFVDLGVDGKLDAFDPSRPNSQVEPFCEHLLRMVAAAVPGTKGTTLTGNYHRESYTSLRAADNDTWPEIEAIQDWFAGHVLTPIYQRWIREGLVNGWFEGIITESEFADHETEYLSVDWTCPHQLAINPKDDATAAQMRIAAGQSTPQTEAAAVNENWEEILAKIVEFKEAAAAVGLEDWANKVLGTTPNVGTNQMGGMAGANAVQQDSNTSPSQDSAAA